LELLLLLVSQKLGNEENQAVLEAPHGKVAKNLEEKRRKMNYLIRL